MESELKKYLDWIFDYFEKENIAFVVLRNYEYLPEENIGGDIDILVDKSSIRRVENILLEFKHRYSLRLLPIIRRSYVYNYRFYKYEVDTQDLFSLLIDIHTNEEAYSFIYLSGKEILQRRRRYKSFYISDPVDEAIISWFSSYLSGGFIKTKYISKILNSIDNFPEEFLSTLSSIIGKKLSQKTMSLIKKEGIRSTIIIRKSIFLKIIVNSFKKRLLKQFMNSIFFLYKELQIRINPPGRIVAIIGPDGCGKSTIASATFKKISGIFVKIFSIVVNSNPVR